jgi:hypothetical protein
MRGVQLDEVVLLVGCHQVYLQPYKT